MKKAIVTGHSKGLGAGMTAALLAEGYEVLGVSRSALPGGAKGLSEVALDLGDAAALESWIEGGALGRFLSGAASAVLVNNAGVIEPIAPLGRQGASAVLRAVTINVAGALALADAFAAATHGVADRRLVHISSGAARHVYSGWSVYCATKAALDHHARGVAEDKLAGFRIESLAPGVLDTGMQATIRATPEADFSSVERFVGLKQSGALGDPHTVGAKIVRHLLGPGFGAAAATDIREV